MLDLRTKKIFFIDNDGTLSLDNKALPGASAFIDTLLKENKIVYVSTNNSSRTPTELSSTLRRRGLNLFEENILISTDAAMSFLKQAGVRRVFWVANAKTAAWLKETGFIFDRKDPEAILLCYDTSITYTKLKECVHFVRAGVPYYATHIDKVCPTKNGSVPDIGVFIDLIASVTDKRPLKTFGKPDKNFVLPVLARHNLSPKDAVVIGDRLYTDVALANNSKASSILVLSGETTMKVYKKATEKVDLLVRGVAELIPLLSSVK